MLQYTRSQRVRYELVAEQQQKHFKMYHKQTNKKYSWTALWRPLAFRTFWVWFLMPLQSYHPSPPSLALCFCHSELAMALLTVLASRPFMHCSLYLEYLPSFAGPPGFTFQSSNPILQESLPKTESGLHVAFYRLPSSLRTQ